MLKSDELCLGIIEMADTPGIKAEKVLKIVKYLTSSDISIITVFDTGMYQFKNNQTGKTVDIPIVRVSTRPLLESACYIADWFSKKIYF